MDFSYVLTLLWVRALLLIQPHFTTSLDSSPIALRYHTLLLCPSAETAAAQNVSPAYQKTSLHSGDDQSEFIAPWNLTRHPSRMADIYVLWLFGLLLANYPADQSAAQPASCRRPLWRFVRQACCSATDAAGVRRGGGVRSNVNYSGCGGLICGLVWRWDPKFVCVFVRVSLVHTACWNTCRRVFAYTVHLSRP